MTVTALGSPEPGRHETFKDRQRRDAFLADHPEWEIGYNPQTGLWESWSGDLGTVLVTASSKTLGRVMDTVERLA